MPYTKEQLKAYWQANKAILNHKRREKRRLAKLSTLVLGLAVSKEVSHSEVSQKVSHQPKTANPPIANPDQVSHGKPIQEMANPKLTRLIKEWQTQTNYNCALNCQINYCSNC